MEAPEKIYLYTEGHVLDNDWLYEAPKEFTSFEYTQTDIFIEKATEWIKNNVEKYYYLDEAYDKVISIKNLNRDFKKAMKGE